jgi:hypothetical protein
MDNAQQNEWWSSDNEYFSHNSLGSLIDAEGLGASDTVYHGRAVPVKVAQLIDASDIIEMLGDRASDLVGEAADDYPDVSEEAHTELNALLAGWVAKHCEPRCFRVVDVHEYVITEGDVA